MKGLLRNLVQTQGLCAAAVIDLVSAVTYIGTSIAASLKVEA